MFGIDSFCLHATKSFFEVANIASKSLNVCMQTTMAQ